jgi:hypothetical protein
MICISVRHCYLLTRSYLIFGFICFIYFFFMTIFSHASFNNFKINESFYTKTWIMISTLLRLMKAFICIKYYGEINPTQIIIIITYLYLNYIASQNITVTSLQVVLQRGPIHTFPIVRLSFQVKQHSFQFFNN